MSVNGFGGAEKRSSADEYDEIRRLLGGLSLLPTAQGYFQIAWQLAKRSRSERGVGQPQREEAKSLSSQP